MTRFHSYTCVVNRVCRTPVLFTIRVYIFDLSTSEPEKTKCSSLFFFLIWIKSLNDLVRGMPPLTDVRNEFKVKSLCLWLSVNFLPFNNNIQHLRQYSLILRKVSGFPSALSSSALPSVLFIANSQLYLIERSKVTRCHRISRRFQLRLRPYFSFYFNKMPCLKPY